MKNKTLFIILIVLLVILIGWTIWVKPKTPIVQTGPSSAATGVSPASASSTVAASHASKVTGSTSGAPTPATIHLNGGQHVTTTNLAVGQKVIITTTAPLNVGYQIDPLQYDSAILGLMSHTHSGSTETWEFAALKAGTTGVTITASQSGNSNSAITLFSNAMSVK